MTRLDIFKKAPMPLRLLLIKNFLPSPYCEENDKYRCIYIHIPRTGGTSICYALFGHLIGHPYLEEFLAHDSEKAQNYFKFALVRNPWDRLVSSYCQMQKNNINPKMKKRWNNLGIETFSDLVKGLEDKQSCSRLFKITHFRPMSEFINSPQKIPMDFIGKFERFKESIYFIQSKIDVNFEIPNLNSSSKTHYTEYYNSKLKDIVAKIYAEDIENFNYDFDVS